MKRIDVCVQITFPPLAGPEHTKFREDVRLAMSHEPWNMNATEPVSCQQSHSLLLVRFRKPESVFTFALFCTYTRTMKYLILNCLKIFHVAFIFH